MRVLTEVQFFLLKKGSPLITAPVYEMDGAVKVWKVYGAVAQLGERYNGIVEVSGSIPLSSTKLLRFMSREACDTSPRVLSVS